MHVYACLDSKIVIQNMTTELIEILIFSLFQFMNECNNLNVHCYVQLIEYYTLYKSKL